MMLSEYSEYIKDAPCNFFCPITQDIMENPVIDPATGISFERAAITEWMFLGNFTCPVTRKKLNFNGFVRNQSLCEEIEQWKTTMTSGEISPSADAAEDDESLAPVEEIETNSALDPRLSAIRERVLKHRDERLIENNDHQDFKLYKKILKSKRSGEGALAEHNQRILNVRERVLKKREHRIRCAFTAAA